MLSAAAQRDDYQNKAKALDDEVLMLTKLLDREEQRFGATVQEVAAAQLSLPSFILDALMARQMGKEELRAKAEAAGFDPDGRSIHATLVNLQRGGKVTEISPGVFKAAG